MEISKNQLHRLPQYLKVLYTLKEEGIKYVRSTMIASILKINPEQVKKDLQLVSSTKGVPKLGREIDSLILDLEKFLGYDKMTETIMVGAGNLGSAFLKYPGFENLGIKIIAAFEQNKDLIGKTINNVKIESIDNLSSFIKEHKIKIAIITVPAVIAQTIADILVDSGIKAIWNFAPIQLNIKNDVIIENVDLASSLSVLSHKLKNN